MSWLAFLSSPINEDDSIPTLSSVACEPACLLHCCMYNTCTYVVRRVMFLASKLGQGFSTHGGMCVTPGSRLQFFLFSQLSVYRCLLGDQVSVVSGASTIIVQSCGVPLLHNAE